ncbi:photosystem I assembly BtpA [Pirellula staleyi DSM 6068]|uniref:Photosystem I assembly BtpA n=1 Tax=Pirellula staleyi (strain ATCC 27377 / DSM 6068 / ICPB 4128) TaxID=530564 RepID=D2QXT9_PIRSD|nr:BtpA/SgcQ family protein [Pirellula staleyi]ADB18016.1 photosystem I assembly BtpA [Pirellula staleyi DSM 6068]
MPLPFASDAPLPVIAMLHLPPLPGSPRSALSISAITEHVCREAEMLTALGAAGLMLENFGDMPLPATQVSPATVAQMSRIAAAVRMASSLPLGINVLRNDSLAAMAIASAVGASFIRVNILVGARLTDQGIIAGRADELLRLRKSLGAEEIQIWADVNVKHSWPLAPVSLEEETENTIRRGLADALIVTGRGTGYETDPHELQAVISAAAGTPVLVGSGVTADSLANFQGASGAIVGSWIKHQGDARSPIDPERVRRLMQASRNSK